MFLGSDVSGVRRTAGRRLRNVVMTTESAREVVHVSEGGGEAGGERLCGFVALLSKGAEPSTSSGRNYCNINV